MRRSIGMAGVLAVLLGQAAGAQTVLERGLSYPQTRRIDHADTYHGTVFVHGELWQAQSSRPVAAGACVRVEGRQGLMLIVQHDGQNGRTINSHQAEAPAVTT